MEGLKKGKYNLEIYKVGYKVNDAYTDYLAMGRPSQLSLEQVKSIKQKDNGAPIATEKVTIDATGKYTTAYKINENDVVMFNFVKQ